MRIWPLFNLNLYSRNTLNTTKFYFVLELLDTIQAPKGFNYVFMSRSVFIPFHLCLFRIHTWEMSRRQSLQNMTYNSHCSSSTLVLYLSVTNMNIDCLSVCICDFHFIYEAFLNRLLKPFVITRHQEYKRKSNGMEDREQERVMPSPLLTTAIMLLSTNQPPSPSSLYNL